LKMILLGFSRDEFRHTLVGIQKRLIDLAVHF
jgi:hypothetical protein